MKEVPLTGYTDRLSVRPGETIEFKVSSHNARPYSASLFRSISADPNPEGPGIQEEDASEYFTPQRFDGMHQPFLRGSFAKSVAKLDLRASLEIEIELKVYPTLLGHEAVLLEVGNLVLYLSEDGRPILSVGQDEVSGEPVRPKSWTRLVAIMSATGDIEIKQESLDPRNTNLHSNKVVAQPSLAFRDFLTLAGSERVAASELYFNGRLEDPEIRVDGKTVAAWDFSKNMSSTRVPATMGPDLALINFPTRAVTGSKWDATEMCWRHAPHHYSAIHFHEDDIYDFEWITNFALTIPDDMPSGIYVMRLKSEDGEDAIPFFVCAPIGKPSAKLCVLVSTFTYVIYGNHARPDFGPAWQKRAAEWDAYPYNPADYPDYGLSTYNEHSDGSGICHASHRRPLFNLRPGYITFGETPCSGLRHFQADSHLIAWLHAKGIDYDIVTDWELHTEGVDALKGYDVVTTGTHPEYHTPQTLDALRDYRDQGGNLCYLGGNGFYWRIAVHSEHDSLLEIRRAEDGIRAWAAEPGEYYHAFDGAYGGLWRRNARPPQELVGIGFAAQGEFVGSPFQRMRVDSELNWVFEGITSEILGDYGLSGKGAAGYELDHCNPKLGTPDNVKVLARSITKAGAFMLVPEEQLTHLTNLVGAPEKDILHADMIYCDWPSGGATFATGSITFCGCLPVNNYENDISKLLENVLRHFMC